MYFSYFCAAGCCRTCFSGCTCTEFPLYNPTKSNLGCLRVSQKLCLFTSHPLLILLP
ncbi:hypothetical protein HanRHA438_Chr09g0384121 [Helianthus annuus]|nr:hypothetical protein HanRHA438_Chr09g0384121 [Helianthus annuus]